MSRLVDDPNWPEVLNAGEARALRHIADQAISWHEQHLGVAA